MNFSKGPSLSPLPWYLVCGKSTHRTCVFFSCAGVFVGITLRVWRRGGGRPACSREKLFEEQKRRKKSHSGQTRSPPSSCAQSTDPLHCLMGLAILFFFPPVIFRVSQLFWCLMAFRREDLTTGHRGRDFLQPIFTEKPSKSFGAAESSWGKTPRSSAAVIADNEL